MCTILGFESHTEKNALVEVTKKTEHKNKYRISALKSGTFVYGSIRKFLLINEIVAQSKPIAILESTMKSIFPNSMDFREIPEVMTISIAPVIRSETNIEFVKLVAENRAKKITQRGVVSIVEADGVIKNALQPIIIIR